MQKSITRRHVITTRTKNYNVLTPITKIRRHGHTVLRCIRGHA